MPQGTRLAGHPSPMPCLSGGRRWISAVTRGDWHALLAVSPHSYTFDGIAARELKPGLRWFVAFEERPLAGWVGAEFDDCFAVVALAGLLDDPGVAVVVCHFVALSSAASLWTRWLSPASYRSVTNLEKMLPRFPLDRARRLRSGQSERQSYVGQ